MLTRGIALVPAVAVTAWLGERGAGQLLVLSQVVLSLQLPFAMIPLVLFTADGAKMGALRAPRWLSALGWVITGVILAADGLLLWNAAAGR